VKNYSVIIINKRLAPIFDTAVSAWRVAKLPLTCIKECKVMRNYSLLVTIIFTCMIAIGCTTRFIADFEADTADALPDTMPAGSPDDQIYVLNFGSGNVAVSSSSAIDGTQSLRISGPSVAGNDGVGNKLVYMYAQEITSTDQRLYANWAGRITSGAGVVIRFFSGHFATLVELKFEDGNIKVAGNSIGTYRANQAHSILVNVDPNTDTYNVSVLGAVSNGATASGSIPNPSALPTGNIGLSFNLTAGGSGDSYIIDTVRMSERDPS